MSQGGLFVCRGKKCTAPQCANGQLKLKTKGVPNPSPEYYGYDRDKVPGIKCMHCKKPIGKKAHREERCFARFGKMSFWCLPCFETLSPREQAKW